MQCKNLLTQIHLAFVNTRKVMCTCHQVYKYGMLIFVAKYWHMHFLLNMNKNCVFFLSGMFLESLYILWFWYRRCHVMQFFPKGVLPSDRFSGNWFQPFETVFQSFSTIFNHLKPLFNHSQRILIVFNLFQPCSAVCVRFLNVFNHC